jgi:CheY-like chemotaxis protein
MYIFGRKISVVILLLLQVGLWAQSSDQSLDILREQVEKEANPLKRIDASLMLAEKMLAQGLVADADFFAELAATESLKTKDKSAQANAFDLRGEVCRMRFDYPNAFTWYGEAQKLRQAENDTRGLAKSEFYLGQVLFSQNEADKARPRVEKALEMFTAESNLTGQAKAQKLLGELYLEQRVFGSAQAHIKAAIDAYVQLNDHPQAAELASRLAKFAAEIGDHEGAMVYHRQSFDLHVGADDKPGMARDFYEMGQVLSKTESKGEAQANFEASQSLFAEVNDTLGMVKSMLGLVGLGAKDKAQTYTQVEQLLETAQLRAEVPGIWAELAAGWAQAGNSAAAYRALNTSNALSAQFAATQKSKELLELDMRYQSQLAESARRRTIERLEMEQASAARVRWGLLALLSLGALALWALWSNYKLKKKDNVLLKEKNDAIANANTRLQELNTKLDDTNVLLVNEIAEREMLESNVFEKDRFLAMVSREMKQPLQQIIRATTHLAEGGMKELSASELSEMQFSANNLLVFINDMLDYNKIETGKLQLEANLFDPGAIFNDIRERFAAQYREQGITFRMEYDSAIPTQLSGDAVRLNQVVSKLLQYLPVSADNQVVTLSVMHGERTSQELQLNIGIAGLDTTDLKNMAWLTNHKNPDFDTALDEERAKTFSLAMVQRLVEMQGGTLQHDGQTISMVLPFQPEAKLPGMENLSKEVITSTITGKRILVVEDNKINQLVVSNLLKSHGALIVTADDGMIALDQMEKNTFDLVLMDIQLPKLDGYRATAAIRKMPDAQKSKVAIVALTASAYLTDKDKAELFQMDDHIGKPFSPEELLQKMVLIFNRENTKHYTK